MCIRVPGIPRKDFLTPQLLVCWNPQLQTRTEYCRGLRAGGGGVVFLGVFARACYWVCGKRLVEVLFKDVLAGESATVKGGREDDAVCEESILLFWGGAGEDADVTWPISQLPPTPPATPNRPTLRWAHHTLHDQGSANLTRRSRSSPGAPPPAF